ncbi:MAG: hypothetical protein IPH18_03715 [Chitinophagaceae bacterium]|nr:hypothetical protein [Chitinophagaceae bacterium]
MKKGILILLYLSLVVTGHSQQLGQVVLSRGSVLSSFGFVTDQQVIIRVSESGNLIEWGTELESYRYNYQPGKLLPYMGRVDYYGQDADSAFRGKVKSIGTCFFTYYPASEVTDKAGKIKSLGKLQFDYFNQYDNVAYKGKLKVAGNYFLGFYSSFDNEAFKGKLKSVDSCPIIYFSSFEDKGIIGKVKSICSVNFDWYTSRDRRELQGSLKSGRFQQVINGVTYILF